MSEWGEGVNQAYCRLSTTHGQITDCKLDSVVYAGVCEPPCKPPIYYVFGVTPSGMSEWVGWYSLPVILMHLLSFRNGNTCTVVPTDSSSVKYQLYIQGCWTQVENQHVSRKPRTLERKLETTS